MTKPCGPGRPGAHTPGRPRAEEGRDTRADLMRVACELFATKGYAGTSVSEIGSRASVTVPVIYQRFGNKAGLFVAVAQDVYGRGIAQLRAGLLSADTFDDAVSAAMRDFATLYQIDPLIGAMVVTVLVEAERDEDLGHALKPTLRSLREYCDDIAKLAPASLAPDVYARRDLSRGLASIFGGIMLSSVLLHRAPEYEQMVTAVGRLLTTPPD